MAKCMRIKDQNYNKYEYKGKKKIDLKKVVYNKMYIHNINFRFIL
jgi:hypothetical protein